MMKNYYYKEIVFEGIIDDMNQNMENEYLVLVKEKAEQKGLSVRDVCVFPVVGSKDDSSVNSTDVILLDEENKYTEVL